MLIATVNVNGIRAAARKGFQTWLAETSPDILLMQEVRAPQDIAVDIVGEKYQTCVAPSELAGRAGVAVAVRHGIDVGDVQVGLPVLSSAEPPVDTGRWLEVHLPQQSMTVISAYLHSGAADKPEKMAAKYAHLDRVNERLAQLAELAEPDEGGGSSSVRAGHHVLIAGDFNIVRSELDIKNWKGNHNKTSGVLDEEIAYLNRWFNTSTGQWADVQRELAGEDPSIYTWWSNRGKAFDNNVGWRIDYQMASADLAKKAVSQRVDKAASYEQRWSDHAPLVIEYAL